MNDERRKENFNEAVKNAASGYLTIVLAIVCFIVVLLVLSVIVRLIVGGGSGVGV